MNFDAFDLLISDLLVVLHTLLLPHVKQLLRHLYRLLCLISKVLIHQPPVEIVLHLQLHRGELFHRKTLRLPLLQVEQVNQLTLAIGDRGQETEAASRRPIELGTCAVHGGQEEPSSLTQCGAVEADPGGSLGARISMRRVWLVIVMHTGLLSHLIVLDLSTLLQNPVQYVNQPVLMMLVPQIYNVLI